MNQDQILSLVRSLAKIAGAALVAHGLTNAANTLNAEDTIGLIVTILGLVLSYREHRPEPTDPKPQPPKT